MTLPLLITPLIAQVDARVTEFFTAGAARMASAASGPVRILVSLYVILWGVAIWRGLVREVLSDSVVRLVRMVLIGALALNAGLYSGQVANRLYQSANQLATVILPSAADTPAGALDAALDQGNTIGWNFVDLASWQSISTSVLALACGLIAWLFTAVLVLYGAALVLVARVGLGVVLALGPIFIAALLFDTTRHFFDAWLRAAVKFTITYCLVAAAISLSLTFFLAAEQSVAEQSASASAPNFSILLAMLVTGGACLVILHEVPGIAAALTGGAASGGFTAIGWGGRQVSPARLHRLSATGSGPRSRSAETPAAAPPSLRSWVNRQVRGSSD